MLLWTLDRNYLFNLNWVWPLQREVNSPENYKYYWYYFYSCNTMSNIYCSFYTSIYFYRNSEFCLVVWRKVEKSFIKHFLIVNANHCSSNTRYLVQKSVWRNVQLWKLLKVCLLWFQIFLQMSKLLWAC